MGALPKKKISRGRQGKRRKNINLKVAKLALCPNCHQPKKPHRACPNCGTYKNLTIAKKEEAVKVRRVE